MSINVTFLCGNLTREPEIRKSAGGLSMMFFTIAENRNRKNQQTGEWEKVPEFHQLTMYGDRCEKLFPYLQKGDKVAVICRLHHYTKEDRGENRTQTQIIVEEIELMSKPSAAPQQPAPAQYGYAPQMPVSQPSAAPQHAPQPVQTNVYDEDIPF